MTEAQKQLMIRLAAWVLGGALAAWIMGVSLEKAIWIILVVIILGVIFRANDLKGDN